ncbi:hypothetical protein CHS0354_013774 [Potamilus streckersoni]|uniref:Chromo domain-containing protein n=1 Tax=Potamilus streckersoni TaxID=2493646 RepID=A0AAE0SHK7_9BIVA|nr:hypothetical protein CHS0354_013774 [Potamilus streckersoni]
MDRIKSKSWTSRCVFEKEIGAYIFGVYSVKAIHVQRKRRGIQQYLVEWEGYTMKEATCEPKRNIPEEIINSLWGNKTHSINKE